MTVIILTALGLLIGSLLTIGHLGLLIWQLRRWRGVELTYRRGISGMSILLLAHLVEIVVFALVFYVADQIDSSGSLVTSSGVVTTSDYFHFSFATYTTVGYGDILIVGSMRILAGVEALIGMFLVGCSSALMFAVFSRIIRKAVADESDTGAVEQNDQER